jgi:hypothetical protein
MLKAREEEMTGKVTDLQTQLEELQKKYQQRLEQEESTKDSVSCFSGVWEVWPFPQLGLPTATHSAHLTQGPLRTQVPFSLNAIKTKCSDLMLSAVLEFKSRLPHSKLNFAVSQCFLAFPQTI